MLIILVFLIKKQVIESQTIEYFSAGGKKAKQNYIRKRSETYFSIPKIASPEARSNFI